MSLFGDIAANADTATVFQAPISPAPSGNFVGTTDSQTLTNKRIEPRKVSLSNPATVDINSDNLDLVSCESCASALTINAPTGTPVEGQELLIKFLDNGSTHAITWNAIFQGSVATALPTQTNGSTTASLYCRFAYDSGVTKWRLLTVTK